jgi:hypothetical protein
MCIRDSSCRGHKFEVGGTYHVNGEIVACQNGWHACENPFDVWSYYGPFESRFAEVELSGSLARHSEDSKIAAATITIKAELSLPQFIGRAIAWLIDHTKGKSEGSSGYGAQIGSSGDGAKIEATGESAVISSAGSYTRAKGAAGTWMALAEFDDEGKCIGFATGCVGNNEIPAETWLIAKGGKLVAED